MGERERERDTGEREGETGERESEIQGRERERYRGEREGETGRKRETDSGERERGRKKKNYKHKKIHGILSCRASLRRTE